MCVYVRVIQACGPLHCNVIYNYYLVFSLLHAESSVICNYHIVSYYYFFHWTHFFIKIFGVPGMYMYVVTGKKSQKKVKILARKTSHRKKVTI